MRRITVTLLEEERNALYDLALRERRNIREQGSLLIRQELERRGLLPEQDTAGQPAGGQGVQHDNQ